MFDRSVEREELWVEPEAAWWLDVGIGRHQTSVSTPANILSSLGTGPGWQRLAGWNVIIYSSRKRVKHFLMPSPREDGYARPGHPGHLRVKAAVESTLPRQTSEFPQKESNQTLGCYFFPFSVGGF